MFSMIAVRRGGIVALTDRLVDNEIHPHPSRSLAPEDR
jgi:hypothetical protein